MSARRERWLIVATPLAAAGAVGLGLRLGARETVRAAYVYGAPASSAGTGISWQVVAFEEGAAGREALADTDIVAVAWRGTQQAAQWSGVTNEDGVAEVVLPVAAADDLRIEVRSAGALLAGGLVGSTEVLERRPSSGTWMPFARREGAIALDVAVLGGRVAPGFPASIWVRATDAATRAPLSRAAVSADPDASLSFARASALTDAEGWAELVATPAGLALSLDLRAASPTRLVGDWIGGLHAAPGASWIKAKARYDPGERPEIEMVAPWSRKTAYLEVDDAHGRAWATTMRLVSEGTSRPAGSARSPLLAPGLYWAVAAADPDGADELAPSASIRPFFVAKTDDAALSFGTDSDACKPRWDPVEESRALWPCLAVAPFAPVPRYKALDGLAQHRALSRDRRNRGLYVAVGAVAIASMLELLLLLRAAARSSLARGSEELIAGAHPLSTPRAGRVAVALFVSLLGFALLAAFLLRLG